MCCFRPGGGDAVPLIKEFVVDSTEDKGRAVSLPTCHFTCPVILLLLHLTFDGTARPGEPAVALPADRRDVPHLGTAQQHLLVQRRQVLRRDGASEKGYQT